MGKCRLKKFALILIVLMLISSFVLISCGNEEDGPRKITQKYFDAVKVGDIEGAIECFTPAFQQQYDMALSLGGMLSKELTGIDASSLLGGLMSLANEAAYRDCSFIADAVEFTNDTHERATVHVTIEGGGDGIPSSTTVNTVLYDGKWYIE